MGAAEGPVVGTAVGTTEGPRVGLVVVGARVGPRLTVGLAVVGTRVGLMVVGT